MAPRFKKKAVKKNIQSQKNDRGGPSVVESDQILPTNAGDEAGGRGRGDIPTVQSEDIPSVPLVSLPESVAGTNREARTELSKFYQATRMAKEKRKKRVAKKKRNYKSYKSYIKKLLKDLHPEISLTAKSLRVLDECVADMLGRIADESRRCAEKTKKQTIKVNDIKASVKLVYGGDLAIHAIAEGMMALEYYKKTKNS